MVLTSDTMSITLMMSIYIRLRTFWTPLVSIWNSLPVGTRYYFRVLLGRFIVCIFWSFVVPAVNCLGPPVAITQRASPYVLLLFLSFFSFFFLFSARTPRSLRRSPRNFGTWSEMGAILKTRSKIWGSFPKKLGPKNMLFWRYFGRLRTSIANIFGTEQDIDNRNIANYDLSRVWWRNLVIFGPETAKNLAVV